MAFVLPFTVTPLTLHPLLRRRPFTFQLAADQATAMYASMRCQMDLVLDGLGTMSRAEKTEAYSFLSTLLTKDAWLPRDTELYHYMQHGFGVLFDVWKSEIPDLSDVADEISLIFTTFGRCQFASGLYDLIRPDLLKRLANYDDSDQLRSKCATALVLGSMISENPTFENRQCQPLFQAGFDQHIGIESRNHILKMAALYMSHLDLPQMELLARTNVLDNLVEHLETQQELQIEASTCLVIMLKTLNSPTGLRCIVEKLKVLAKNSRPIRHNLKFLTVENRVESIKKFAEIGLLVKIDSIRKRLMLQTFKQVLDADFVRVLDQTENCFVRQVLKPESLMRAQIERKNILVRTIRRVF